MSELAAIHKLARHLAQHGALPPRAASALEWTIFDSDAEDLPAALQRELETQLDHNPRLAWATAAVVREITRAHPDCRVGACAAVYMARALNECGEFNQTLALCESAALQYAREGYTEIAAQLWMEAAWAQSYLGGPAQTQAFIARAQALVGKHASTEHKNRVKWIKAHILRERSNYAASTKLFERLQAAYRAQGDTANAMRVLYEIGHNKTRTDPDQTPIELQTARAYFVRTHHPIQAAHCDHFLGQLANAQNRLAEAEQKLSHALKVFQKFKLDYFAGVVYLDLGVRDWHLGHYSEMLRASERARDTFARLGAPREHTISNLNIASAYSEMNRFDEALPLLELALQDALTHGRQAQAATCMMDLGQIYAIRGQYARTLDMLQNARSIYRKIRRVEYSIVCDFEIARVYAQLNQPQAMLAAIQRAKQLATRKKLTNRVAQGELYRAQVLLTRGQTKAAETALQKAREGFAQLGQTVHVAFCDRLRAEILTTAPAESLALITNARAVFQSQQQPMDAAVCDLIRAEIYLRQKALQEAKADLEQAQGILQYFPAYKARVEYALARVKKERDPAAALLHYMTAAQIVAQLRGGAGLEELSDSLFQARENVIVEGLELANRLGESMQALVLIQSAKAQLFARSLTPQPSQALTLSPYAQKLRNQEQTLRYQLDKLRKQAAWQVEASALPAGAQSSQAKLDEISTLARKYEKVVAELRIATRGIPGLALLDQFNLGEFRAAAHARWGSHWCALDYYLTPDRLYIVTIDNKRVELESRAWTPMDQVMLNNATSAHRDHREMVYNRTLHGTRVPARMDALQHLAPKLVPSALNADTNTHLLVSPHGLLHQLAFQALPTSKGTLLERYTISYIPNFQAFTRLTAAKTTRAKKMLVCGARTFPPPTQPLKHTHAEVNAVKVLYPHAQVLWQAATPRDMLLEWNRTRVLAHFDLLHFATHAVVHGDAPHTSGILLGTQDVTVLDILEWELNAHLVTLSACSSGLGKGGSGDEWVGLAHAFFYAGARALVTSLWAVEDASTTKLMQRFYTHLKRGDAIAVALRKAQQEMAAAGATPFQWAAFTASGAV